jgi:uncharacterized protein
MNDQPQQPQSDETPLRTETAAPEAAPPDVPKLLSNVFVEEYPPQVRIPHLGHLVVVGLLLFTSVFVTALLLRSAVYFHLFGVETLAQAATNIRFTLGGEALTYLFTLFGAVLLFPVLWGRGFFDGIHWNERTALRHPFALASVALLCFLLAMVNGYFMPGPTDAPIEQVFRAPGAAWLLMGFGVTFAPFFEELFFRGFLLPSLCTAFDWVGEQAKDMPPRRLDADGNPRWSRVSMAIGAVVTSVPFALMHAAQTGRAVGPFLLLYCISLVLCAVRLAMRSVAASVVVHAGYNFLLFALMYLGSSGFKHLDKM